MYFINIGIFNESYIYILLLLLSDLGNARVIIAAVLLIGTITPYIYTYL